MRDLFDYVESPEAERLRKDWKEWHEKNRELFERIWVICQEYTPHE
jgi:hypothetical protein